MIETDMAPAIPYVDPPKTSDEADMSSMPHHPITTKPALHLKLELELELIEPLF